MSPEFRGQNLGNGSGLPEMGHAMDKLKALSRITLLVAILSLCSGTVIAGALQPPSAQETEYPGTLGFQLGLKAIHGVESSKDVTGETRKLFDEAIAVLEREMEEDGYIDPVNHSDRVGILYALYEGCRYWDKAVSLFERVLQEGETDSVRYYMAVELLPRVRERAAAQARQRSDIPPGFYLLAIAVVGALLLILSRRRRRT
jgi:hypothetical protein